MATVQQAFFLWLIYPDGMDPAKVPADRTGEGYGGETGIRTLGGLAPTTVFETAPFDHSGTSPRRVWEGRLRWGPGPCKGDLGSPVHILYLLRGPIRERPMIRTALLMLIALLAAPLRADPVHDLYEALGLPRVIEVMQAEGIEYGDQIAADMFAGRSAEDWEATVRLIYDDQAMKLAVINGMRAELEGKDVPAMLAFFEAEPGRSIVALEVAGREALLDSAVEESAKSALAEAEGSERLDLVRAYIAANDLVDSNVVGALNANYAFYGGLVDGGAFDFILTDEQILTEVWASEPDIRASTTEWVESFLLMAYAPLPDADLEAYIAFSESALGQDLNTALFAAFDPMFNDISRALGLGAARYMAGEEL